MFKFKDIIKMDYETYKRMISKINASQSEFVLRLNKEQSAVELTVDHVVVEQYSFAVEPWMEPEEE